MPSLSQGRRFGKDDGGVGLKMGKSPIYTALNDVTDQNLDSRYFCILNLTLTLTFTITQILTLTKS